MRSLNGREQLFVAFGAAIGSNCVPCVEKIVPKARAAGIEDWELRLALNAADFVRKKPAANVLATAEALIDGTEGQVADGIACPLDQGESVPAAAAARPADTRSGCCG